MNQPILPPLAVTRVESYKDNRGRIVLAMWPLSRDNVYLQASTPTFIGQGVAGVQVMTPQGPMVQQVPFEIHFKDVATIFEAFEKFDTVQEQAFRDHMEKMRLEALKHGADLSQLPRAHKQR